MPRALKVTEENLDYIINYGAGLKFDLDHVRYDLEDATVFGNCDLYLITDGTREDDNITFTTLWSSDFFRHWKFTTMEDTDFAEIEKV